MCSAMARRMLDSGTSCASRAVTWGVLTAADVCRCCKTSALVIRLALDLICAASMPSSASNRAATGVGFGTRDAPVTDDVHTSGGGAVAGESAAADDVSEVDPVGVAATSPDGGGAAETPMR